MQLTPGTILQQRYEIVRPIGQGGFGAVYEALHVSIRNRVAVKQLLLPERGMRQAFQREAQILGHLRHPSLVRVIDHFGDDAGEFLVMDYIDGADLGVQLSSRTSPFPLDIVLTWADQLLDALEYLHRQNPPIVHRDIKPHNLKIGSDQRVMLLDFGLAKGTIFTQQLTISRSIQGYTPLYAPMEQIHGTGVDERSDLASLGATIYHLLAHTPAPDALARGTAVLRSQPDPLQPLSTLRADVPTPVSEVIQSAMALNPDQRPASATAMRAALRTAASQGQRGDGPQVIHAPQQHSSAGMQTRVVPKLAPTPNPPPMLRPQHEPKPPQDVRPPQDQTFPVQRQRRRVAFGGSGDGNTGYRNSILKGLASVCAVIFIMLAFQISRDPDPDPDPPTTTTRETIGPINITRTEITPSPTLSRGGTSTTDTTALPTLPGSGPLVSTSDELRFGFPFEPLTLDPMAAEPDALILARQIHEPLIGRNAEGALLPLLAESWEANADFTVWTLGLRQGVTFHDGAPLDAHAVHFNLHRMGDPSFEFGFRDAGKRYPAFPKLFGGDLGDQDCVLASIEIVDEHTITFTMKRPFIMLPDVLASTDLAMSSPAAVQKHGADYGTAAGAVGTGPFQLDHWEPGDGIQLGRNERYWGTQSAAPMVRVSFFPDERVRFNALLAGEVDFTINLSPFDRDGLTDSLKEVQVEPLHIGFIAFDFNTPPFDDVRVRQAIAYAIDRDALFERFYDSPGGPAYDHLPAVLGWARESNRARYEYDPELARALLEDAGYPDGIGSMNIDGQEVPIELWYPPSPSSSIQQPEELALEIAAQLEEAGFTVLVRTDSDSTTYINDIIQGKKHGMWMIGWTVDTPDPAYFFRSLFGSSAEASQGYQGSRVRSILEDISHTGVPEEMTLQLQVADSIISEDLPLLPLAHTAPIYGARADLQGWTPVPFGHESWATVRIGE